MEILISSTPKDDFCLLGKPPLRRSLFEYFVVELWGSSSPVRFFAVLFFMS